MNQEQIQRPKLKIVDSAEPDGIRTRLIELGWQQQRLYSADYWWQAIDFKRIGATRKRVDDLMNSIGDRLSGQLEEMLDYYDICIWIIEGSWRQVMNTTLLVKGVRYQTWDMVWNYIHRWMAKGFILEMTTSEQHTIHRLNVLYALYQKPYSLSGKSRKFTDDRILAMPSGCRGKTGQTLLEAFGSLKNVAEATPELLEQVDGIGGKKAESIYNHFNRS